MILQRLFRFSSIIQSAVSVHLRRNIGVTAVAFNKELDPVQKIFVDKIREYRTKRQSSGGPVDTGPEYQQDLERELFKLKQMYGKADMNTFPDFKFEVYGCSLLQCCTEEGKLEAGEEEGSPKELPFERLSCILPK
ncbi:ATP synthase peripheral stalk subunit F6 [Rhinolophus ferrumequinum]|uniref:ATP synthase peripheral stalk subunit F6, mitochondrial n=1 Tax=Rhinolophus ferrumequinum TaxID=59479 RepID=A0A7J8ACY4_RHIFE|nr:ATP synthase peripheral stalk subunit F6 [Rhinolophus ferrumequinum]